MEPLLNTGVGYKSRIGSPTPREVFAPQDTQTSVARLRWHPALALMSQGARDRSLLTSLLSLSSLQLRNDFQAPLPQLIVKTHKGLVSVPVVDVVATTAQFRFLTGIIMLLRRGRIGVGRVINRLAGDEVGTERPDVDVLI